MRTSHEVKSWPDNFSNAITGRKRFEVRKDDRSPAYATGDTIILREFDPLPGPDDDVGTPHGYTGRRVFFVIGFVDRSPAMPTGWCAFDLISSEDIARAAAAILVGAGQ